MARTATLTGLSDTVSKLEKIVARGERAKPKLAEFQAKLAQMLASQDEASIKALIDAKMAEIEKIRSLVNGSPEKAPRKGKA